MQANHSITSFIHSDTIYHTVVPTFSISFRQLGKKWTLSEWSAVSFQLRVHSLVTMQFSSSDRSFVLCSDAIVSDDRVYSSDSFWRQCESKLTLRNIIFNYSPDHCACRIHSVLMTLTLLVTAWSMQQNGKAVRDRSHITLRADIGTTHTRASSVASAFWSILTGSGVYNGPAVARVLRTTEVVLPRYYEYQYKLTYKILK